MNKVRNKETNEHMPSRNIGTGQDSNLERQYHPGRAPVFRTKVRNKEINEQMHSTNTGTGQDSNQERLGERPLPYPLSEREFSLTQLLGIVFKPE